MLRRPSTSLLFLLCIVPVACIDASTFTVLAHPDFEEKYENNPDPQNRGLAFEKMLREVMLKRRKDELELYKLFANDPAFKAAWQRSMEQVLNKDLR